MSPSGDVYNTYNIGSSTDPWGTPHRRSLRNDVDYLFTILKVGIEPAQGFAINTKETRESLRKNLVIHNVKSCR